jgi:hypothetical protein
MTRILEGTWEEIKLHDAELIGKHVRITVEVEPTEEDRRTNIQQRKAAWERLDAYMVHGDDVDDSREAIYGNDIDRG